MSKLGLRLHADEEHWIPLSDLMTGLMFLFLVVSLAYMVAAELKHAKPASILRGYAASRAQMYNELTATLGPGLQRWHGTIDAATLSVRFSGNTGLFQRGSAELTPQFQEALNQFFPRYVSILERHRSEIRELRIEGYTSTGGTYVDDMALSQQRARNVLNYVVGFQSIKPHLPWLTQILSADGYSYSHPVRVKSGAEDPAASDRVEFHVIGDANTKIAAALKAMPSAAPSVKATPTPLPPPTINAPLPAYPAWAQNLMGTPLVKAFPHTAVRCFGYVDTVLAQYVGRPSGTQVSGWAFDLDAWRAVDRVVLVDSRGTIVGAADGGFDRSDVQKSIRWITSPNTGWRGSVAAAGGVTPWAVMAAPQTACRLGVAATIARDKL